MNSKLKHSALIGRVYMDSMMLVVVTLGELQSTRKASQHLTLKSNCEIFWSHIFDSSDSGMYAKDWERMPVVWCRGISETFGDVWNRGGVKMDVKKCLWNGECFWKRNIDWKWVENALEYQLFVWLGCSRNSLGESSFYISIKKQEGSITSSKLIGND